MSSLKVQPLTSQNRTGATSVVFDCHMRSVSASFNFLKLRPMAFLLWTTVSTAIFKFRQTHLQNYSEILLVLSGSVILAQGALFLTLLYEASTQAPGPDVVGKLDEFADQDPSNVVGTTTTTVVADTSSGNVKKRAAKDSSSPAPAAPGNDGTPAQSTRVINKDNQFWVLEQGEDNNVVGCIGALVDKAKGEAQLVSWAVAPNSQRKGAGTLLLKTAMNQLCGESSSSSKKDKKRVDKVKVVLQGSQVPALRLYHKLGFVQVDRTPEWLGERVVLEMMANDWIKGQH
ncbi:hypothetical protein BGZ70_002170 [Mortierella alpina]|uniref:N-acetyltransferase domain-containing protein n=1 Tax=Mortierella alpina TaxID=64518 RepID=A0A9P6IUK0_MORAP|nr:hypothetical protein BGZ70_002170 [Mortierella alpina]